MSPWICALLIAVAGAARGVVNALLTDNAFILPRRKPAENNIWCPGALSNIFIGAVSALVSWAMYGAGAGIDLAADQRERISFRLSALAGGCLVGIAGARWITNEAEKSLLREGVKEASKKVVSDEECRQFIHAPARHMLRAIKHSKGTVSSTGEPELS